MAFLVNHEIVCEKLAMDTMIQFIKQCELVQRSVSPSCSYWLKKNNWFFPGCQRLYYKAVIAHSVDIALTITSSK